MEGKRGYGPIYFKRPGPAVLKFMPTYIFLNRNTNQLIEEVLRMSEYDAFVRKHPHLERYHDVSANLASQIIESRRKKIGFPPKSKPRAKVKKGSTPVIVYGIDYRVGKLTDI